MTVLDAKYRPPEDLRYWRVCSSDVEHINRLLSMGFDGHTADHLTLESLRQLLNGSTKLFGIRLKLNDPFGEIVSMATLCITSNLRATMGHVHHVVTHRDHLQRGLSRAVLSDLLNTCDIFPMKYVTLTCSSKRAGARKLYEALGFRNITETKMSDFDRGQLGEPETALFRRDHPDYEKASQKVVKLG